MMNIDWRRVFFCTVLFYLVYTAPTEGEGGKPVALEVTPEKVFADGGFAKVVVKWRIEPHPDNLKYSFAVVSDSGNDYRVVSGDLGSEALAFEDTRFLRQGFYAFEVCAYRQKAKPVCDKKFVEVK